jgi:hypothetical protein
LIRFLPGGLAEGQPAGQEEDTAGVHLQPETKPRIHLSAGERQINRSRALLKAVSALK